MVHLLYKASIQTGVQSLVYTSTYNVVFGGQEIRNGNESLPYFPLHKVKVQPYSLYPYINMYIAC